MAALLCGLSLSVTSCSDDDDKMSEEEKQAEQAKANDDANLFFNVVSQLTNGDAITDDYKNQTFEPTIGQIEGANTHVRIVGTNNMATAVKRFNDLTGAKISEGTTDYEWKNDAVGTLTWHKVNDGRDYATVEVNIKQMPTLYKIVYRDGDQMGTNGKFNGRAYYRFGDVVEKDGHYWVCVRPAFGPESKQDSHWVCVDKLDEKNAEKCTKGGKTWYVPKKLGENTEQMKNFAEMLYAMFYPIDWYQYFDEKDIDDKNPYFHDFHYANLMYHNVGYWKNVMKNWRTNKLFEKVFGVSEDVVRDAVIEDEKLHLMCWGHSWWTWSSWNLTLKEYTYSYNSNTMFEEKEVEKEVNMEGKDVFDLRGEYWKQWKALAQFFGDEDENTPRWIIRHAKGKELTKNYNEQEKLADCKDVYTYYTEHEASKNLPPDITVNEGTGKVGEILGLNGKFYDTALDAQFGSTKPVGIVIYRGEPGSFDTKWHPKASGLVWSLEDVGGLKYWALDGSTKYIKGDGITDIEYSYEIYSDPYKSKDLEGYQTNLTLIGQSVSMFPAIASAIEYNGKNQVKTEGNLVSEWYLPTYGELSMAFYWLASHAGEILPEYYEGSTLQDFYRGGNDCFFTENFSKLLKVLFEEAYVPQLHSYLRGILFSEPKNSYWTATQSKENGEAWAFVIKDSSTYFYKQAKTEGISLRPVCLFRTE